MRGRPNGGLLRGAGRLVLIVVLMAVGAVAGLLVGEQRGASYTAGATILLAPLDGNAFSPGGRGDDLVNLQTEAQLVTGDAVARLVIRNEGLDVEPFEVTMGLEVSTPANTQILDISYTSDDPRVAVQRAQAFAEGYLQFREDRATSFVNSRTDRIDEQIALQNETLDTLVRRANRSGSTTLQRLLSEQIDVTTAQLSELRTQRSAYQATPTDPGQLVTPAVRAVGDPVSAPALFGLLGALVGLGLGLLPILVRSRAGERDVMPADFDGLGIPLLGRLSPEHADDVADAVRSGNGVVLALDRGFKSLRASLLARERQRPVAVLVASATADMGAPRSVLGLAHSLALSNVDTVLVDATGGLGGAAADLDLVQERGLTDVLTGDLDVDGGLVRLTPHLQFLAPGRALDRFEDLVAAPQMGRLMADLRERCDVVLVVTGSIHDSTAQAVASVVDRVVVEAAEGQVKVRDVVGLGPDSALAANLLGVVYLTRGGRRGSRTPASS